MEKRPLSRREALKGLAAATGAAALAGLPNKWKTPIVQVGALPAHAQGTFSVEVIGTGDYTNGSTAYNEYFVQVSFNIPVGVLTYDIQLVTGSGVPATCDTLLYMAYNTTNNPYSFTQITGTDYGGVVQFVVGFLGPTCTTVVVQVILTDNNSTPHTVQATLTL